MLKITKSITNSIEKLKSLTQQAIVNPEKKAEIKAKAEELIRDIQVKRQKLSEMPTRSELALPIKQIQNSKPAVTFIRADSRVTKPMPTTPIAGLKRLHS